jgi:hypothetical protein
MDVTHRREVTNFNRSFIVRLLFLLLLMHLPVANAWPETTYRFERMWPMLQQPWYFNIPTDIARSLNGVLYILDAEGFVGEFSEAGQFVSIWRGGGSGIAYCDTTNTIYLAEFFRRAVGRYRPGGEFLGNLLVGEIEEFPVDVSVDEYGTIYVLEAVTNRVLKSDASGNFLKAWGNGGSGPGEFQLAYDTAPSSSIVVRKGVVYVTDSLNHRVQKFDTEGAFLAQWGSFGDGPGEFNLPSEINIAPDGTVFVYDFSNYRFQQFDAEGNYLREFPHVNGMGKAGVTFSPNGDLYACGQMQIAFYTPSPEHEPNGKWSAQSTEQLPGHFNLPDGVAIGPDGCVYVTEWIPARVQKFNPSGQFLTQWDLGLACNLDIDLDNMVYVCDGGCFIAKYTSDGVYIDTYGGHGSGDGQFDFWMSGDIAVDNAGSMYVVDSHNHRIQKLTVDGVYIGQWGSYGTGNGQFDTPESIAVDMAAGYVYVLDGWNNNRVQKFTLDGTYVSQWGTLGYGPGELVEPKAIEVDGDGLVLVGDHLRVQWFDPSTGSLVRSIGQKGTAPCSFNRIYSVAADPASGAVYTVEGFNQRVQKFTPADLADNAKAVIVTGGGAYPGNNLWDATQASANYAYRSLVSQGFTKETIHYLSPNTHLDLDGNGVADDVDADCTSANLEHALTDWAPSMLNGLPTSDVVVYLVDHGGPSTFRMSATEVLDAGQFASWVDEMQAGVSGKVTVVYDACDSGTFVPHLANPTHAGKRLVITSTSPGESAYFVSTGTVSFSNYFWTEIFNGSSVGAAFGAATDGLGETFQYQTPLLDDTADGVGNGPGDGTLAAATYLGNSTPMFWEAPTVGGVSSPQSLDGTATASLWADPVTDGDGVARVWAVIRPPDFATSSSSTPVTGLPTVDFLPTFPGSERWEASHGGFTTGGTYTILIYARDRIGNTSVPAVTTVTVTNPLSRKVLLMAGGDALSSEWPAVERVSQTAYYSLLSQGYGAADINFLSRTGTTGVDALAVLANIEYACTTWVSGSTQDFTVYLMGSATATGFTVNPAEELTWVQLKTWLDALQETLPGKVTVVCDADGAGAMLPLLTPAFGQTRILAASTTSVGTAGWLRSGQVSFSQYFIGQMANGASMSQAFAYAAQAMRFATGQLAQLDDNGDGVYNTKADGLLAREYWIGNGILLAGDEPVIGDIIPPQTISGSPSATVWVEQVTTTGTIADVTALVFPPDGGEAVEVPLTDTGGNRWEVAWTGFLNEGVYRVRVMATDTKDQSSIPHETTVTQSDNLADIDSDWDGLTNAEEHAAGTKFDNPDTDGDGILDGDEVKV